MLKPNRILIVDDEQDLCEILRYNLDSAGYQVEVSYSAEEALRSYLSPPSDLPDLIILDVMMPGMSGFEMAALLKENEHTARIPIIFLTAKDTEDDTLRGFGLGADDYVTKPFSVREVVARVGAVLQRSATPGSTEGQGWGVSVLAHRGLVLNLLSKAAMVDDVPVQLTKTEFELLALLLSHRGQVFSRQEVLDLVWPQDVIVTDRTVDVNVTRLRRKIGPYAKHIVSRLGYGYVYEETL